MWDFFKQTIFLFIYLVFMAVIALAIDMINIPVLEGVLFIVSLALYTFIAVSSSYKDGKDGVKLMHSNDMQRKHMIETGEIVRIKSGGEYRVWKGFFSGFIVTLPLIICLIVHGILMGTTGSNAAGGVAAAGYMMFYAVFGAFVPQSFSALGGHYFILLYAVPYMIIACGIPYMLGGRKIQKQYDKIKETQELIYGKQDK